MKDYFDDIRSISKKDFIDLFRKHETKRPKKDKFMFDMIKVHKETNDAAYYQGSLNQAGLNNIVVPHNAVEIESGRDPDRPVAVGGELMTSVINKFKKFQMNGRFPGRLDKIRSETEVFFDGKELEDFVEADFLYVSNSRDLAHSGNEHYHAKHEENKLYIGNGFHRFIAYALWVDKVGFKPIRIYYCEGL